MADGSCDMGRNQGGQVSSSRPLSRRDVAGGPSRIEKEDDKVKVRRFASWCLPLTLATSMLLACTDSNLYHRSHEPVSADRVTLSGRVCTEDPVQARFPVRIVLVMDRAMGPLFGDFDPAGTRLRVLNDFLQIALAIPEYELAIVGYAGDAQKLAPVDGNFTRDPGQLMSGIAQLGAPQSCLPDGRCRDYRRGLRMARALIEGDIASLPAGERVLTQYVVLLVNAGPHEPLALEADCCPAGDVRCIQQGSSPSAECQANIEVQEAAGIRTTVSESGAAGLRLHVLHLAADRDPAVNEAVSAGLERMALAGTGLYQRFNLAESFNLTSLNLLNLRTSLRYKTFMAANINAKPTPDGPVVDSDGDGLSDEEEQALGYCKDEHGNPILDAHGEPMLKADPTLRDTSGDGIGDLVTLLLGYDLCNPPELTECEGLPPGRDVDGDGLTDCEEILLGTDPSLVDTDGDGMPDGLEVMLGTDWLNPDAELDWDGDGVSNLDEVRARTDPRSSDRAQHLAEGYRYQIEDLGVSLEISPSRVRRIPGVTLSSVSSSTSPGLGALRYYSGPAPSLSWQDASESRPGPVVAIGGGGRLTLPAASWAPEQGDDGKRIFVEVDPEVLPPNDVTESIRIVFQERQCIEYTVRNIRLMPTLERPDRGAGWNDIFLYFLQAPQGRPTAPGPVRIAHVPVRFIPPDRREPDDRVIIVRDEEFVRPSVQELRVQ